MTITVKQVKDFYEKDAVSQKNNTYTLETTATAVQEDNNAGCDMMSKVSLDSLVKSWGVPYYVGTAWPMNDTKSTSEANEQSKVPPYPIGYIKPIGIELKFNSGTIQAFNSYYTSGGVAGPAYHIGGVDRAHFGSLESAGETITQTAKQAVITRSEYYQLLGLETLAKSYYDKMNDIEMEMAKLIKETPTDSYTDSRVADVVWSGGSELTVTDLLSELNIIVVG